MEDDFFAITLDEEAESRTVKNGAKSRFASPFPRDYQSEVDFQAIKASYQPKIENGEV